MYQLPAKNRLIAFSVIAIIIAGGVYLFFYAKNHKTEFAVNSLNLFQKVSKLLPLAPDTKKEIEITNTLVQEFTKQDDKIRSFMILLQNDHELRPGGGFLGQYAIIKIKNGAVISSFVEDANLLDQRIKNANIKITPPWPLIRYAQTKRWLLHDSNFSPDFPFNAEKAEYFYRLGGGREKFDGVIAVNSDVFNHILELAGPITVSVESFTKTLDGAYVKKIDTRTFSGENGTLLLEEAVEKKFIDDKDVPAELKQNRKNLMKQIAAEIIQRLNHIESIPKIAEFVQQELRNKNVMLYFPDENLQSLAESVHWDGGVAKDWPSDYLMLVDANLGALKTDYYIKRSLDYLVDFTGEKPRATVTYTYNHTATHGDWRTSDYHTYTRILAPQGAKYIEQTRKNTGGILTQDSPELKKTVFGYKVDAVIGQTLETSIQYELPDTITPENYRLLIQKQSGVGSLPVTVHLKTKDQEYTENAELTKDLNFSIQTIEENK